MNKIFCLSLLILLCNLNYYCQQYNFKKYSPKDGLANFNVKQIFQSKNGYLWMATQGGGLSRFDGKNFKNYSKKDGLVSNDLSCIEEDSEGNLWIGTVEGLCIFNGFSFKKYTAQGKIGKDLIYHIYRDSYGNMWVSTDTKGLFIIKKDKIISIDTVNGLKKNRVFTVVQENENSFWVGTHRGGTYNLNKEGKINFKIDTIQGWPRASIFCLYKSSKNEIYAGTNNSGLFKITNKKFVKVEIPGLEKEFIGSLISDKKNNLWVATEIKGLIKFSSNATKCFSEREGLSSDIVNSVATDYEGNLWIATQNGGACVLKTDAILTYTNKDGLNDNKINSILKLKDSIVLVGTMGKGICIQDKTTSKFNKLKISPITDESLIANILELNDNKLILGSDNGIFIIKKSEGKFRLEKHINQIEGQAISSPVLGISSMKDNTFWVAFFGEGLVHFSESGEIIKKYDNKNGLNTNQLISLHNDHENKLYVAQFCDNYNKEIKCNSIIEVKNENIQPLINQKIPLTWCIESDKKGTIFFGTQDEGLIILNKGKIFQIDISNGLCSNYIQSIVVEDDGTIWLGTDKGVNKIKLDGNYKITQLRKFSNNDGLISPEVSLNGMIKDNQGYVWICTSEGLTRIDVAQYEANLNPPKIIISEIELNFKKVDWTMYSDSLEKNRNIPNGLVLKYNENHLTFHFAALTVDEVKYKYYLENLDKIWSPFKDENQAVYSNIPPGKYIFHVKAYNVNGIESENEIKFEFEILPPFWRTWWFYTICFLIFALVIFFIFKWQSAKQESEHLESLVNERTKDLQQSNEHLSILLQEIKDSINYAERIQRSFLATKELLDSNLRDYFVFFQPKDVVSGDFYWAAKLEDGNFLYATADSTGHGVPGAIMSILNISSLEKSVEKFREPSEILNETRKIIIQRLKQDGSAEGGKDGMDCSLIVLNNERTKFTYAAANNPVWIVRKNKEGLAELVEANPDKMPVGKHERDGIPFKQNEIELLKGDIIYTLTDGMPDQFGGPKGKKYKYAPLKNFLCSIHHLSMIEQKEKLKNEFENWKGNLEQVDDVCIIGVRV